MKVAIEHITPALARTWLEKYNASNRTMRPSHVETLRQAFARGEYTLTHQGIAFDIEGQLLDGQHRLAAIATMAAHDIFPMLVARGLPRGATYGAIDTIAARRSFADALNVPGRVAEVANFFLRFVRGSSVGNTPALIVPYVQWVRPQIDNLIARCNHATRTWSSAPVRAAAVLAMKRQGSDDYVLRAYRALTLSTFDDMPPIVQSLYRANVAGSIRSSASTDLFLRSLKAFSPKNADLSRVHISDVSAAAEEVRNEVRQAITPKED